MDNSVLMDALIVVDMQNDFIDGSLGSKEAVAIVDNVKKKIDAYRAAGKQIIFTRDTHYDNYLDTFEGSHLPVSHCIEGSDGWQVSSKLALDDCECKYIDKKTFGWISWNEFDFSSVEMCGVCTDICVISNALIIRAHFPEMEIRVDSSCCAGVTPEAHEAALTVMKSCQIDVM